MESAYVLAAAFRIGVTFAHVGGVVHSARMIHGMHANCLRAGVFRHVHPAAQSHLQHGTAATVTAEKVDNDPIVLRVEAECALSFEIDGVLLLLCVH
jgi:hypothetical protein